MNTKIKVVQAIKVWIVIYPSITLFQMIFGKYLKEVPLYAKNFILTIVLVPWMVFIGLPLVNKVQQLLSRNE